MASSITRFDIEKLDGNIIQIMEFEVELHKVQGDHEVEVFHVSNDDDAVAQRWLEDKQLEERTNTYYLLQIVAQTRFSVVVDDKTKETIAVTMRENMDKMRAKMRNAYMAENTSGTVVTQQGEGQMGC
ncbi:hypothetical protein Tco_0897262 [Tanacetum coccineum]